VVLWRAYPGSWVFARKPAIGPPRSLLTRDASEGRPETEELEAALEAERGGGGLFDMLKG
jgi:hypothetical protein